jgi:hypothetical protein
LLSPSWMMEEEELMMVWGVSLLFID